MASILPKAQILTLLRFEREQELRMVGDLSDVERNASSDADHWVAKDYIANILVWKELHTQKLAAILRGEIPPVWTDSEVVAALDSSGFKRFQDRAFNEVLAEAERVHDAFLAQVDVLSDDELNDSQHFSWQEGEPLRGETLGNGLWHPCSRLSALYLQSGREAAALKLQEDLLATVRQTDMPSENLGYVVYNAACFLAVNGRPERALQLLPEALRMRPTLIEWSKHDSDLDALRSSPALQAIYDDPALRVHADASVLVSVDALRNLLREANPPLIIDARGSAEYEAGHIDGAINIPLGLLERRLADLPRNQPIVTYCNMHHRGESRGERAAAHLRQRGFEARTLDGGYPTWKDRGFPVE